MTDLDTTIAEAARNGLRELQVKPCVGGWQAVAVHETRQRGPWHVAVNACPVAALRLALSEMTTDKPEPTDIFS